MVSYSVVEGRFPTYERSDGVPQMLVPIPRCKLCFKPIPEKYADWGLCYDCNRGSPIDGAILERVIAATLYIPRATGYPHSREIIRLKELGEYADQYAEVLEYALNDEEGLRVDREGLLVPIPQTKSRKGVVGPEALAIALSRRLGPPVEKSLRFDRDVVSQKDLTVAQRKENVQDSMIFGGRLDQKAVYLVDDIITTGNMMQEGARAVRAAGARTVIGLAAGRDANLRSLAFAGVLERIED